MSVEENEGNNRKEEEKQESGGCGANGTLYNAGRGNNPEGTNKS